MDRGPHTGAFRRLGTTRREGSRGDVVEVHIGEAAQWLGVTPHYLRMLEWDGRIPSARRDFNGRIYSECDLTLLKALGVGARPVRLKHIEDVLGERT